jgi:hypothetical protein
MRLDGVDVVSREQDGDATRLGQEGARQRTGADDWEMVGREKSCRQLGEVGGERKAEIETWLHTMWENSNPILGMGDVLIDLS